MNKLESKNSSRWPEALIVIQSVIYGFGDPISKIAFEVTPVYTMMTVRYTIGFAVCFLLFRKRVIETLKNVPARAWLIPGCCIGLSYILNNVALSLTDATSVAFLRSLSVVITPVFAFLFFKNRFRWQHLLIQILVIPGLYLLCVQGGLSGFGAGEILALAAAALMAGALVFTKSYIETVDPASMTPQQVLRSATRAGALSQGREDCGLVKEGYKADLIVVDVSGPNWAACDDMANGLIYSADGKDVCLTMCDGMTLFRDGEYTFIDIEKTCAEAENAKQEILKKL